MKTAALFLSLLVFGAGLGHCAAPPPTPAQIAAESAYTGALLACVEKSASLAESKACRAEVDRSWGIVQTATDGGSR